MALSAADQAVLKELADTVVQQLIPQAVADIEAKLPSFYAGLVSMIVSPLLAGVEVQLQAWVDAKIATL